MPIHYALYRNYVSPTGDDYAAIVKTIDSVDLQGMIDRMIQRGSTTSRADILAVLEDAIGSAESLLLDGMRLNFGGLVELFPRVKGVFTDPTDGFESARHAVDVGAAPGIRVRNTVRNKASLVKDESVKPTPNLLQYRDVASDTVDASVTPGSIGEIAGSRLKFDDAQADEGIYYVPTAVGAAVKVTVLQRNKPASLVFLNPATLASGDYRLEVRARIAGGTELRTGALDALVTVA